MKTEYKHIYYRPGRNSYEIKVNVNGKQIVRTAKNLDEALEIREDIMDLYRLDKSILENVAQKKELISPILEKALSYWYEKQHRPLLAVKTQEAWDAAVYDRIIPTFGKMKWIEVTHETIQQWCLALQMNGNKFGGALNSETVRSFVSKFRSFYSYLISVDVIDKNIMEP